MDKFVRRLRAFFFPSLTAKAPPQPQARRPPPNPPPHDASSHRCGVQEADHGPIPNLRPSSALRYHMRPPQAAPAAKQRAEPTPCPRAAPAAAINHHQGAVAPPSQRPQAPQPSFTIPGLTLLQAAVQAAPRPDAPPALAGAEAPKPSTAVKKRKKRKPAGAAANGPQPSPSTSSVPPATPQKDKGERQPPSSESGGIPEPTPLYLARTLAPPIALPCPRRILVILDLNGTLLYRPARHRPTKFVERPHARRFLEYCLEAFCLAVWSSARPENVERMLGQLLTAEQRRRCVVAWGRDRLGLCPGDYGARVQCYKRLSVAWADAAVQASHPAAQLGGRWDQSNTVLVDDSPEKGRSEPHNILAVPEFSGVQSEGVHVLPQVHDYLNSLCYQGDVSSYMREQPFRLDPDYRLPDVPLPLEETTASFATAQVRGAPIPQPALS